MWGAHACHGICVKTVFGSLFSPSTLWVLGGQTQVIRLDNKHLDQLCHLPSTPTPLFLLGFVAVVVGITILTMVRWKFNAILIYHS